MLFFQDIRVFDGNAVLRRANVLVDLDRIVAIGAGLRRPPGAEVFDGTGRTLLPGLIDAHIHLTGPALRQGLSFGVTTQLDMFADGATLSAARTEAAEHPDVSDVRSAGIGATAPGGHPAQLAGHGLFGDFPTVASAAEADAFVAARIADGSDYLKVFASSVPGEAHLPALPAEVVDALVASAHRRGLLAIVHATDVGSALSAVEAGADGLAHLPFDRPLGARFVAAMARGRTFAVPTLTMLESFCGLRNNGPLLACPAARTLDVEARSTLAGVMEPASAGGYEVAHAVNAVRPLLDAGVPVLAGTDAGAPGTAHGLSLHRELELLVAAGLTPVEALAAATSVPARCFRLPDRGEIAPGKRADLLVVAGDPTASITATRDLVAVFRAGHRVSLTR